MLTMEAGGAVGTSTAAMGGIAERNASAGTQADTATSFVDDVHNMVLDFCEDGVIAFQRCLEEALTPDQFSEGQLPPVPEELFHVLEKGTQRMYDSLVSKAEAGLQLFEMACTSHVFQQPTAAAVPQVQPMELPAASVSGVAEGEGELAERVAALRAQLTTLDASCCRLKEHLQAVDRQLLSRGDVGDYAAVSSTATGNKATILAIAHAAANLHNMMERAARLRAERQQQQAGAGRTEGPGAPLACGLVNETRTSAADAAAFAQRVKV